MVITADSHNLAPPIHPSTLGGLQVMPWYLVTATQTYYATVEATSEDEAIAQIRRTQAWDGCDDALTDYIAVTDDAGSPRPRNETRAIPDHLDDDMDEGA
jgi:hypothetical protein